MVRAHLDRYVILISLSRDERVAAGLLERRIRTEP